MKRYTLKINGQKYQVEINEIEGENAKVTVNGIDYDVEIQGDEVKKAAPTIIHKPVSIHKPATVTTVAAPKTSTSTYKVESPLPGTIKKVNVAVGDSVKEGDCLMIMEAMKMDNNILAEKGGIVKVIKVREGDAVLQGGILVEIA